jgi:hypothetical protein
LQTWDAGERESILHLGDGGVGVGLVERGDCAVVGGVAIAGVGSGLTGLELEALVAVTTVVCLAFCGALRGDDGG